MIVVTGGAGFIGSYLISELNRARFKDVVVVDDFSNPEKVKNLENNSLAGMVHRRHFFDWLDEYQQEVQFIFHLGARTDTTEFDWKILEELNLEYSKKVWNKAVEHSLPLIYASSAATYGGGEKGYSDNPPNPEDLSPLNPYGKSKNDFDRWALAQKEQPFFWMGFKFFNVYGPNEYHKGRMASVIWHAFHQIKETGKMKLFRSHNADFEDGKQLRDFIYVKDLVQVLCHFMEHRNPVNNGIYNLGTGEARSFLDLVKAVFKGMDEKENIEFIDMPEDLRETYQYFTQAEMDKLAKAGYQQSFTKLEDGVIDYVQNYLVKGKYHRS